MCSVYPAGPGFLAPLPSAQYDLDASWGYSTQFDSQYASYMTLPPLSGFVDPNCGFVSSDLVGGEEESDPSLLMDTNSSNSGSMVVEQQQQQQLEDKLQQDSIQNFFDS